MLTLYDYPPSQNAYKIRLLLSHLRRPYETRSVSIFEGEGQRPDYLAINPTGAVPAIRLETGETLAESNAILLYLAEGTPYLPDAPLARAKVAQWLFFEADYVQAGVATLRHWVMTGKDKRRTPEVIAARRGLALKTLALLDRELARRPFLATDAYSVADMAVFAYIHRADEAGLPLSEHAHLGAWIERIKAQEGFLAETFPYSVDPHSSGEL